jgi:predicted permease
MFARSVIDGLRRLFRKDEVEDDLSDEVDHYLEMAAREHMRRGLSRAEAERAARIDFGGIEAVKEQVRGGGWEAAVDALWRDMRIGARGLRRNPAFTVVAVLTLALGIGANTAMFSVVNAVILRPLPYRDAQRLVLIWTDDVRRGLHQERTATSTIGDWREGNHTLADIAFYNVGRATLGGAVRERSRRAFVSGNLFAVLAVSPARGRVISPDDERDAAEVAVISHSLWERRFDSDSNVVGKSLYIEDADKGRTGVFRVIGVMPPGFFFPDRQTELWTPSMTYWRFVRESTERFPPWARRWIGVARIKPDASLSEVRSDLANVGRRLALLYPSDLPDFPGFTTNVVPILDSVAGRNLQSALWLLLGAVALVLLVACANVANLLLARGAARHHEFALRRALGAARGRLVRQLVVESLVLAAAGGMLGVALALFGTRVLAVVAAEQLPRMEEIGIDGRVLMFVAGVSLVSAIVFGIAPALRVSGADASEILKEGRSIASGRRGRRIRGLLIVAECSLTIVLLSGAGLVLRSLERLRSVEPGFDPRNVLTVRLEFPPEGPTVAEEQAQTPQADQARARAREQKLNELTERIEALPGVKAVGFVDDMFISGSANKSITIPGRTSDSSVSGELNDGAVTPGFFRALRVPLRRGRYLTSDDALTKIRALWSPVSSDVTVAARQRLAAAEPVVVNEAFARRFFATEEPIDKRFCIDPTNKPYCYVIVGVIGDMHRQGLERHTIPEYFRALVPSPLARSDLLVRTRGDPLVAVPTVRQLIASVFPGALIPQVSTADRQLGDFSAQRTIQTWLLTSFAALALALAGVGIYGVVHYAVAERTREIGIRIALGAAAPNVVRMVIAQGMRLPLVGLLIGLAAALGLTRLMTRLLFGTSPTDPLTYAAVTLVLVAVAIGACYAPARRAAAIEPVDALRRE